MLRLGVLPRRLARLVNPKKRHALTIDVGETTQIVTLA